MSNIPKYCRFKSRDVGYSYYNRKKIYFPGKYNSPESRAAYLQFVATLETGDASLFERRQTTVAELCAQFLRWAQVYYRKLGRSTGTYERFAQIVVPPLLELYYDLPVGKMNVARLRRLRDALLTRDLCRNTINDRIGWTKQIFNWGEENLVVPSDVAASVRSLKPLEIDRSPARETEPVRPVPDRDVRLTVLNASQTIADLIETIRYTGMRPGEARNLSWRQIDRSGAVWLYKPVDHKTRHRGKVRVVPIAKRAQETLLKYEHKTPDEPIFSPRDAVRERYAAPNGDVSEAVAARIERTAKRYTKDALCRAIARAAKRAGVPSWSPNQLRHAAATEIREKLGLEVARIVLGHSSTSTTEIYAEIAARRVADDVGKIWE